MTTITFDTLAYARKLKEAGVEDKQAEAQASALSDVLKSGSNDLATQRDIESLRADLKRDIEVIRAEVKRDIAEVNQRIAETKADLIRWVVGVGILQTTLLVGILARLAKVI